MKTHHTPTTYNATEEAQHKFNDGTPTNLLTVYTPTSACWQTINDDVCKRIITEKTRLSVTDLHLGFRDQRPSFANALLVLDRDNAEHEKAAEAIPEHPNAAQVWRTCSRTFVQLEQLVSKTIRHTAPRVAQM